MKEDFLTLTSNLTNFFILMTHIVLHGWNHQNVSCLINQTNVSNNICFGPVEPKIQWRMQCSQISEKTNIYFQIKFSDLLIMRTMKQKMIKIGVCMGLHLYTKK